MKKIIISLFAVCALVSTANAEMLGFDTRIGSYFTDAGSMISYRNSRLDVNLPFIVSGRVVSSTMDGMGFVGTLNNYRLGIQAVYGFDIPGLLTLKPFIGTGLTNSDAVNNSLSFDFGFDSKIPFIELFSFVVGAEMVTFSDSYNLDYYAGPSFPVLGWFTVDALYTGYYSNSKHKLGAAVRVNLKF